MIRTSRKWQLNAVVLRCAGKARYSKIRRLSHLLCTGIVDSVPVVVIEDRQGEYRGLLNAGSSQISSVEHRSVFNVNLDGPPPAGSEVLHLTVVGR